MDEQACGFGTFQSHNQKVVSNSNGIFMTYLREDNEKDNERPDVWRLVDSKDGGRSFSTVYEGRNNSRAPCLDEALTRDEGTTTRIFHHQNTLYSVYGLSDTNGTIVENYTYDPYGKQTIIDGTDNYNNAIAYTGQRLDVETGLMYYCAYSHS